MRIGENGRAGEIRTHDLLHPMQARYQATLQPEQKKGHKASCPGPTQVLFRLGAHMAWRGVKSPPKLGKSLRNPVRTFRCYQGISLEHRPLWPETQGAGTSASRKPR